MRVKTLNQQKVTNQDTNKGGRAGIRVRFTYLTYIFSHEVVKCFT